MEKMNLKELFEKDNYVKSSNMEFVKLEGDNLVLKMNPNKNQMNAYNILHGAQMFSLMDTAAGCLCIINGKKAVTLDSSINFIASSVLGEEVFSKTKIIHMGRSTAVVEVEAHTNKKLLAKGSFTLFVVDEIEISGNEFLNN